MNVIYIFDFPCHMNDKRRLIITKKVKVWYISFYLHNISLIEYVVFFVNTTFYSIRILDLRFWCLYKMIRGHKG